MVFERTAWVVVAGCLLGSGFAKAGCDEEVAREVRSVARVVDSLRLDKPGQARVFAADGAEFTGGQTLWLKGQLRAIDSACVRGDREEATRRLSPVVDLVRAREAK